MGSHEEKYVSKPLRQVLNGRFPAKDVKRMNHKALENFVLKLIQHSMADGAKTKKSFISVCNDFNSKQITKPAWWPSDKILGPDFPPNSHILLTNRLRLLVLKCAEFFRNSCDNYVKELYIDENNVNPDQHDLEVLRRSLRVRSLSKDNELNQVTKKRKTLHLKNSSPQQVQASCQQETLVLSSPTIDISNKIFNTEVEICFKRQTIIPLTDVLKTKTVEESQDQTSFLGNLFGLSKNELKDDSKNEKLIIPSYNNHLIKLTNSHNIPVSSDIGRMLIERDAHCFPESLRTRKCERLEWYINKNSHRLVEVKYEVAYQETKKDTSYNDSCHIYKFPKRQFCQYQYPTKFQLEVCKSLKVVLRRDNLEDLKKTWKTPRMLQIVLPQLFKVKTEKVKTHIYNRVLNPVKIQRLACSPIKKGAELEKNKNVLLKKVPSPFNMEIKKENEDQNNCQVQSLVMCPQPIKSDKKVKKEMIQKYPVKDFKVQRPVKGKSSGKSIKLKVQGLCGVKKHKSLEKVAKKKESLTIKKFMVQTLNKTVPQTKVLALSKIKHPDIVKSQKLSPNKSKQNKSQQSKIVKSPSVKKKCKKSKSLKPHDKKVQKLNTQSKGKSKTINKVKTQLRVQKNIGSRSPNSKVQKHQLQINLTVQQSKNKLGNTKVKKVFQKQRKQSIGKIKISKPKKATLKGQSSLKKNKIKIKKYKGQCPIQGKPQIKHKTDLFMQDPSKIKHKGKRKE